MFNKSFKKEYYYVIGLGIVLVWILYYCTWREHFEAELESTRTNKRIDELTDQVESLQKDFQDAGKKMEYQGQQAAAAASSLQAIPTGYNNVILSNI